MNKLSTITTAVALTLGITTAAIAHQGEGRGMGTGMQHGKHQGMHGGQHQGMNHGEGHGKHGEAKGHGKHGANAAQSLATPEERTAMRENRGHNHGPAGALQSPGNTD